MSLKGWSIFSCVLRAPRANSLITTKYIRQDTSVQISPASSCAFAINWSTGNSPDYGIVNVICTIDTTVFYVVICCACSQKTTLLLSCFAVCAFAAGWATTGAHSITILVTRRMKELFYIFRSIMTFPAASSSPAAISRELLILN